MTIQGDNGGKGTKAIANRYPVVEGLTGASEKQTGRVMNLVPTGKSLVSKRQKVGM